MANLRKEARGRECQVRLVGVCNHNPETVVLAHYRMAGLGVDERNGVVFWASGDSMTPTIDDGDQLLVDRNKQEIKDGKIYIIQHRGTMWVKRVRWGFNEVFLVSDNEDYEPISIGYEEAEDLQVVGQVVNITKSVI